MVMVQVQLLILSSDKDKYFQSLLVILAEDIPLHQKLKLQNQMYLHTQKVILLVYQKVSLSLIMVEHIIQIKLLDLLSNPTLFLLLSMLLAISEKVKLLNRLLMVLKQQEQRLQNGEKVLIYLKQKTLQVYSERTYHLKLMLVLLLLHLNLFLLLPLKKRLQVSMITQVSLELIVVDQVYLIKKLLIVISIKTIHMLLNLKHQLISGVNLLSLQHTLLVSSCLVRLMQKVLLMQRCQLKCQKHLISLLYNFGILIKIRLQLKVLNKFLLKLFRKQRTKEFVEVLVLLHLLNLILMNFVLLNLEYTIRLLIFTIIQLLQENHGGLKIHLLDTMIVKVD